MANAPPLPRAVARRHPPVWRDYLLALAAVAAALALRYLLNPILGQQGPYLILTLAVVVPALYAGFGPALFATFLATVVGTWLFIGSAPGAADVFQPSNIGRTLLFVAIGVSISVIGGRLRRSRLELAASVLRLRASNRAKDDALATLGHEIRNPLSALQSARELLRRFPDQPDTVAKVGDVVQRQVAQMTRMADDLLDLSGITRGEVAIQHRRVVLQPVLRQALEQCSALVARKGHRLKVELDAAPAEVVGDEARLVQVFANLLTNAAKYTPQGGEIVLSLRAHHGVAIVTVEDNGIGMDPDAIAELFEPSFTYSYSTGLALMPRSGGAIQAAILPGSVTRCIRLLTKASCRLRLGSHSSFFASNSACADRLAFRRGRHAGPHAHLAAEARGRQLQLEGDAGALDRHVPARHADVAVLDVLQARDLVHAVAHADGLVLHAALPSGTWMVISVPFSTWSANLASSGRPLMPLLK
jgi:signal transduction histidine kinase